MLSDRSAINILRACFQHELQVSVTNMLLFLIIFSTPCFTDSWCIHDVKSSFRNLLLCQMNLHKSVLSCCRPDGDCVFE